MKQSYRTGSCAPAEIWKNQEYLRLMQEETQVGCAARNFVNPSAKVGRSSLHFLRKFCINISSFVVTEFETIIPTNRPTESRNRLNLYFSVCGLPWV